MTTDTDLAGQLLDAQVAWMLTRVQGEPLRELIARDVDDLLALADGVQLDAILTADDCARLARRVLDAVPAGVAATTAVETVADVVAEGPGEEFAASEVLAREHVERLVAEALALTPQLERGLEQLTTSPLMGTLATRFISKLVIDVLEANQSVADRIPGVGSLMSLGTNVATKAVGVADRQVGALLGDTAGKGAAIAIRRLNAVVIDTLNDPLVADAAMQVWDQHGDDPIAGPGGELGREDLRRIGGLLQEMVLTGAGTAPVQAFVEAAARGFFEQYAAYPVGALLADLGVTRDDLVAELETLAPPVIEAALADGWLEDALRRRLEPFFRSDAVAALLAG